VSGDGVSFREGTAADLRHTYALSQRTMHSLAIEQGYLPAAPERSDAQIDVSWSRHRALEEFVDAQERRYVIAENSNGPVAFARVVCFDGMEELTDLMVGPDHQGRGIGRTLLQQVWGGDPSPAVGRLVVATGNPRDLSLYTDFGVMPVAGHWHMRQRAEVYLHNRAQEMMDTTDPGVHVLKADRAVAEWKRLEPPAIAHGRPALHEFFGRDRTCLATIDGDSGQARSLCWVSADGDIGPAVAASPGELVPVVLAALDRVAMTQEPHVLSVFSSTLAWWLLSRLRGLGFSVYWPSWILCSVPLPGLDRYMPTRPPHLL